MLAALGMAAIGATLLAGPAGAGGGRDADGADDPGIVQVIEVSGLLDPVLVSFVEDELADARAGAEQHVALVLQLNSGGSVVAEERLDELVEAVERSPVTIGVWVGPSGSKADAEATRLVAAADISGIAPGSRIEVTTELVGDRDLGGRVAVGETVGSETAVELDLVDNRAPGIGDFLLGVPGFESEVLDGGRAPLTPVRFGQLGLVDQLFHTVASPAVAYLLLVIAGCLLVFELYTAGVGIAGMVGVGSLVLAGYGLAVLPTNTWALAVLGLCFVAFAVDVQTGVPRFWTGVGAVGLIAGSLGLYADGPPSWITLLAGIGGTLLAMLGGMPAMIRTRFSTPTIGRDWMIGETGVAVGTVAPDGVVTVRDAPWRARTNRATPIGAGETIRVAAIDGLVLEVEPLEGGARDHRSRASELD